MTKQAELILTSESGQANAFASPHSSVKPPAPYRTGTAWVPNKCECGSKGGAYLGHWQIMRCNCGRLHWALQPERGAPLKLFPWPGPHFLTEANEGNEE